MKKALLLLLFAVSLNLSAQSTTYFAKAVELNVVPASTTQSDSVLVRGADRIIKFVPRSAFAGGGGSTPTLQQVTTSGATTTDKIILDNSSKGNMGEINGAQLTFAKGSGQIATFSADKAEVKTDYGSGLLTGGGIYAINDALGTSTSVLSGEIQFGKSDRGHIDLIADTTGVDVDNYDVLLQRKSGTIALLSDVGLQQIVDGSGTNVASTPQSFSLIGYGSGATAATTFLINNGLSGVDSNTNVMSVTGVSVDLSNEVNNGENISSINLQGGGMTLKSQVGVVSSNIVIDAPTLYTGTIHFPSPANDRVNFVNINQVITDVTDTAYSASDLNTAYPNALKGDRIQCLDIIAGAKMYEKTVAGWVEYSVTVVP